MVGAIALMLDFRATFTGCVSTMVAAEDTLEFVARELVLSCRSRGDFSSSASAVATDGTPPLKSGAFMDNVEARLGTSCSARFGVPGESMGVKPVLMFSTVAEMRTDWFFLIARLLSVSLSSLGTSELAIVLRRRILVVIVLRGLSVEFDVTALRPQLEHVYLLAGEANTEGEAGGEPNRRTSVKLFLLGLESGESIKPSSSSTAGGMRIVPALDMFEVEVSRMGDGIEERFVGDAGGL